MSRMFSLILIKIIILILLLAGQTIVLPIHAQDTSVEKYLLPPQSGDNETKTPEPYNPDEFASWTYFLFRFVAVSVGVFPIAVLLSSIGYDSYKTSIESQRSGRFEQKYLPLFFGGADKPQYTSDEVGLVLLSAMGISLAVGAIDLIIAIVKDAQAKSLENLFRDDEYGSRKSKSVF